MLPRLLIAVTLATALGACDKFPGNDNAKKAANERRRAHDLRNDPDEILRYRNEKRQIKAEQHLRRMEEKKMRDEAYLAKRSTIEK